MKSKHCVLVLDARLFVIDREPGEQPMVGSISQQYFVEDGLDTNGRVRASIGSDITEMLRRLTREQTAIEAADQKAEASID
jgi:hypothetical protein